MKTERVREALKAYRALALERLGGEMLLAAVHGVNFDLWIARDIDHDLDTLDELLDEDSRRSNAIIEELVKRIEAKR